MATIRPKTQRKKEPREIVQVKTIDGRLFHILKKGNEYLVDRKKCAGGNSYGCKQMAVHLFTAPRLIEIYIGDGSEYPVQHKIERHKYFRRVVFTKDEAKSKYWCRTCHGFMGCMECAQRLTELVCLECHDWATDEAEEEHGKMVPKEKLTDLAAMIQLSTLLPNVRSEFDPEERRALLKQQVDLLIGKKP